MSDKPQLTVFAGCNGSGKSSFSSSLISDTIIPFDFDLEKRRKLDAIKFDFEFSEELTYNQTLELFESTAQKALDLKTDFAYETNFNYNPLKWPLRFKDAGFEINLVFFILADLDKAKERVAIRVEQGGHFVSDVEITDRFQKGYLHLNSCYRTFDQIQLFDTSAYGKAPEQLLFIRNSDVILLEKLPDYLRERVPDLSEYIDKTTEQQQSSD